MNNSEPLHVKSNPSPLSFSLRNIELIMFLWFSVMLAIAMFPLSVNDSAVKYIIFLIFLFIFIFVGRKRGRFINSGLEYFVYKNRIELYSGVIPPF